MASLSFLPSQLNGPRPNAFSGGFAGGPGRGFAPASTGILDTSSSPLGGGVVDYARDQFAQALQATASDVA